VSERFDCRDPQEQEGGVEAAAAALQQGGLVVLPTDTVYGLAADAFQPAAVRRLLRVKGRGRDMPPPVLVSAVTTLEALAEDVSPAARALVDKYWPGPLTLVCRQQPSLRWDLGDTRGTVAVRMPDQPHALALLERTGPLAVSSANITGQPAALSVDAAEQMLADAVDVYLDAGPSAGDEPSSIVDATTDPPRLLRAGAVSLEELLATVPDLDQVG
jgi:tRNA threonylcarbamoyl adenosine modification protein (Sua5/YciO/YrdC/YwlC family)